MERLSRVEPGPPQSDIIVFMDEEGEHKSSIEVSMIPGKEEGIDVSLRYRSEYLF